MGQVFPKMPDPDHGSVGVISSEHVHGTCCLTKRTTCAQVKMGADEFLGPEHFSSLLLILKVLPATF
jgi:hypothetical protein